MVDVIFPFMMGLAGFAAVFCIWGLICNQLTYMDRGKLIHYVFHEAPDYRKALQLYDRVSYDDHVWARVFLKNPRLLYPEELRNVF